MATVTVTGLAEKLGPKVRAAFEAREKEIVSSAHPWFVRQAIGLAYPVFLNQIPSLTRMAIDFVATEFGAMDVNDLLAFIDAHTKSGQEWRFRPERSSSPSPNGGQPGVVRGPSDSSGPTP